MGPGERSGARGSCKEQGESSTPGSFHLRMSRVPSQRAGSSHPLLILRGHSVRRRGTPAPPNTSSPVLSAAQETQRQHEG